jgi:Zn-dependent protease
MILSLLLQDPLLFVAWIVAVLVTLSLHEFSHALVATLQGDTTPEHQGRLTLDPRAHIDWLGLLMLVTVGFGWGKPVQFNPYNLKLPRWGATLVAFAGPISNFIAAVVFGAAAGILVRFGVVGPDNLLMQFLMLLVTLNVVLGMFNLIPIPPLDGSKILYGLLHDPKYGHILHFVETKGPTILFVLIFLDIFTGISIFGGLFTSALNITGRILGVFI